MPSNTINGNGQDNNLIGTAADDLMRGRRGDDTMEGGLGNDTIKGGRGNDLMKGGEGETISAVTLFVDLVNYTAMSNSHSRTEVIKVLNVFYDINDTAVVANYGEILKFIGDGALIIFPVVDDLTALEAAAQNALNTVASSKAKIESHSSDTPIEFRASLHIGEIFYGNVGSQNRLDFTAVGPAVNLASRLLDQASILNVRTVCSEKFNAITSIVVVTGTKCDLKGFNEAVSVFVVE